MPGYFCGRDPEVERSRHRVAIVLPLFDLAQCIRKFPHDRCVFYKTVGVLAACLHCRCKEGWKPKSQVKKQGQTVTLPSSWHSELSSDCLFFFGWPWYPLCVPFLMPGIFSGSISTGSHGSHLGGRLHSWQRHLRREGEDCDCPKDVLSTVDSGIQESHDKES